KFVSELGKPGPYAARTPRTIQRWKLLRAVPEGLKEGMPNRDVIRDTVLRAGPEAWEVLYSLHNGTLPLDELSRSSSSQVVYLQGEVHVTQGGPVDLLTSKIPAIIWIDEEPFERPSGAVVQLTPGRHLITVRVMVGAERTPGLRLELRPPAGSRTR